MERPKTQHSLKEGLGKGARQWEAVDAAPFLGWLKTWSTWQAVRRAGESESARREGCGAASIEDLASLAGTSARAYRRVRQSGRVSIDLVDRTLMAAGGDTMLWELYPELYP